MDRVGFFLSRLAFTAIAWPLFFLAVLVIAAACLGDKLIWCGDGAMTAFVITAIAGSVAAGWGIGDRIMKRMERR